MSECEKLSNRTSEWNAIYPFMEWLQEQGVILCRYFKDEGGNEYLQPIGESLQDLLYKYFNVDPAKLEMERREILANLGKAKPT